MVLLLHISGHDIVAITAIFVIFAKMAAPIIAINFKLLWPFLALFQRLAKMQISTEDGIKKCALYTKLWQKKIGSKMWPFPLYFEVILPWKWPFQGRHFPCEFRAHPYLFGIRRARGMGLDRLLIQILTFIFFAPPPNVQGVSRKMSRSVCLISLAISSLESYNIS